MNTDNSETNENLPGNLGASIEEIRGGMFYATVVYDNGYTAKISGELFPGAKFIASRKSVKKWEPPHEGEIMTAKMADKLIADVEKCNAPGKVIITFS